jgi:outer membrane protein TolC
MMHSYRLWKSSCVLSLAGLLVAVMASNAAAETLEQAWTIARDADHGLKASRDNSAAAASELAAAKSARLPVLATGVDYFALTNLPELKADLLSQSFQIPLAQRNSVLYDATATLPIYTGGRIEHGIAAAASSLQAAKLNETADEQNLRLLVRFRSWPRPWLQCRCRRASGALH